MTSTCIHITIHATSTWNEEGKTQGHCDTPLSAAGEQMAALFGTRADLNSIQAIYTSDLKRAWQTAQPLADRLGLSVNQSPDLREGNWADYYRDPDLKPLPCAYGFENPDDLSIRAQRAMQTIATSCGASPILIVTHGGFLRTFLNSRLFEQTLGYLGIRTAINTLSWEDGRWSVVSLNDDTHLRAFEKPDVTKLDHG